VRRGRLRLAAGLAALALAGCANVPPEQLKPEPPEAVASLARLPGWAGEDHAAAFAAVNTACAEAPRLAASRTCAAARSQGPLDDRAARTFLERHFRAEPIAGEGLLTGYFAPVYAARLAPTGEFSAPVRRPPADPAAAPDRAEIDRQPSSDALAWMRPEDLFFLQIQGSGVLAFPDGARRRAVFAGSNGKPFVGIGRLLIARGLIAPAAASADAEHDWLAAHRGPEATALIDEDPRYVFFRLAADDGTEPLGAAGAPMLPGRSVAVDPAQHPYFELLWLDADAPTLTGARPKYQRLVVALDTGGAIRGAVRADLYLGRGPDAGAEAARVRHDLRLYHIVPITEPAR
jgi:membrane-bound lytic murein transglycosylase A